MEYVKSVSVSGYMLSSLLYEHNSSLSDQEGFLIGDVIIRQTESISDNQLSQKREETIINIYSHVPCDDVYSFYTFNCDIEPDKLKYYLKDKIQEVVGWYRFRRHTPLVMSLREKTVHKNLMAAFPDGSRLAFGLFSSFVSDNCATHTFDHMFYLCNNTKEGSFEPVTLNIVNLEDSSHDEYRLFPRAPVNIRSGIYSDVTSCNRGEDQVLESVLLAEDINTVLLDKIEGLVEQVGSAEAEIGFLALDIKELEEKIAKFMPVVQAISPDEEVAAYLSITETAAESEVLESDIFDVVQKEENEVLPQNITVCEDNIGSDESESEEVGCARTRCFLKKKDPCHSNIESVDKS